MKGDFDNADSQVRRLMEAIGGSADAYEEPRPAPVAEPAPDSKKPNPFLDGSQPDHGLVVVDEPEGGSLGKPEGYQPEPGEGSEPDEHDDCAYGLGDLTPDDLTLDPDPLDESYVLHDTITVCGELAAVWKGFSLSICEDQPQQVQLDSGLYETRKLPEGCWVLDDPMKGKRYANEIGNLAGHLEKGELFIWAVSLSDPNQDFGYIHQEDVFVKKP